MKNTIAVLALIVALIALGIVALRPASGVPEAKKETAFERVMRTRTLRCGYISWSASYFMKDPVTHEFKGVGYDLAEGLAKVLNVKNEWVEEVGLGNMYEGLKTGRYDAICTPILQDATGGPHATFTRAAYYSPLYAYARSDDSRFDLKDPHVLDHINDPKVTVVDVDGSNGVEIYKNRYPKAHLLSLPGITPAPDIISHVLTKKADITQQNPAFLEDFLKARPGSLKRVSEALLVFPTSIMVVPKGDYALREWMDLGIESMIQIGTMDRILDAYDPQRFLFLRSDKGFGTASQSH